MVWCGVAVDLVGDRLLQGAALVVHLLPGLPESTGVADSRGVMWSGVVWW